MTKFSFLIDSFQDGMFLRKAEEVANLLLPAFDTTTGIYDRLID